MNFFSLRALWKAIRGRSLLFALVFSMAVFGVSFAGLLREPMKALGLWLPVVWLAPVVLISWLAKKEDKLPVRPGFRLWTSLALVLGSLATVYALWRYERWFADAHPKPERLFEEENEERRFPKGPRGKH